jgi:hypothetical protein
MQRVVCVTATGQGGLLGSAADLVDDLGGEFHHVERVEDGNSVGEFIADGVRVTPERVQGGVLDPRQEIRELSFQPAGVSGRGPAGPTSRRRAFSSPYSSRARSTIAVTARSADRFDGRQRCLSTPRSRTLLSRSGRPVRAMASAFTACHRVCQSTRRWRANADTVVSSWARAAVAHRIARDVRTDREPINS